jgi:hypothetical protein
MGLIFIANIVPRTRSLKLQRNFKRISLNSYLALEASSSVHNHVKNNQKATMQYIENLSDADWVDLNTAPSQLRPDLTLITGQCFNWRRLYDGQVGRDSLEEPSQVEDRYWVGVLGQFPLVIKQTPTTTLAACLLSSIQNIAEITTAGTIDNAASARASGHIRASKKQQYSADSKSVNIHIPDRETVRQLLRDYFQLDHSLEGLYKEWAGGCPRMKTVTQCLEGEIIYTCSIQCRRQYQLCRAV